MRVELACPWPVQPPEKLWGGMAAKIEAAKARTGEYPPEWPAAAWLIKTMAGWKCERCKHPHGPVPWVLTVHHLIHHTGPRDKWNLEHWNLAALCQRCHLRVQHRVLFNRDWPFEHSAWMAVHVADYNEWALRNDQPLLSLNGVVERDYSQEWPE